MDENLHALPAENGHVMNRAYFERLTTDALLQMADDWGVDIPFGLDRIFIIEELLDIISEEEDGAVLEPDMVDSGAGEAVPLPKQYNFTFIEVMVRDPLWAFVFWEIKSQDKEQLEKSQDFSGYYLKVTPMAAASEVFRVPVKPEDTAWYLGFNPPLVTGNNNAGIQYKVELCAVLKDNELVLVASKPFTLPVLYELSFCPGKEGVSGNSLCRLSGCEDFHVLRNSERLFRAKRGAPDGSYE